MITTTEKLKPQVQPEEPPAVIEARALSSDIQSIQVVDATSFSLVAGWLKRLKTIKQSIDEFFDPDIRKAYELHKSLVAKKKKFTDPLDRDEKIAKGKMGEFVRLEDQRRATAQREAEAAQRKLDEDRRLAEAAELEKKGRGAEAMRVLDRPAALPAIVVQSETPEVKGVSTSYRYSATCTDLMALAKAVVEGTVPMQAILPNEKFLNNQAGQMKEALKYPGVTVNKNPVISSRAG